MLKLRFQSVVFVVALMCLSVLPALSGTASASSWWNSAWSRRAPVVITETSGSALTNYQAKVVVTYDSDMKSDFSDVRFADATSATELSYWLESKTDGSTATFWVKVPSIPASGTATIEMYYGNPGASTTSDIHNTFIWGDDFQNPAWTDNNINKWNADGGISSQGVVNGEYQLQGSYVPARVHQRSRNQPQRADRRDSTTWTSKPKPRSTENILPFPRKLHSRYRGRTLKSITTTRPIR